MSKRSPGLGFRAGQAWVPAVLACILVGCDESTPPPTTLTERTSGRIAAGAATNVRTGNPIGPIQIEGEDIGPWVRWALDKEVTAPTPDEAQQALTEIVVDSVVAGDSVTARVAQPPVSQTIDYQAFLSLAIPFASHCTVDEVVGDVTVRYLVGNLEVEGGRRVTVVDHVGSCSVAGSGGDVSIRIVLPSTGSCVVTTPTGAIDVSVPAVTSAHVSIVAGDGTITVEGLSLTGVIQTAHTLEGTLGAGEGEIRLETSAGSVVLRALIAEPAPRRGSDARSLAGAD